MKLTECIICEKTLEETDRNGVNWNRRLAPYRMPLCFDCIKMIGEVIDNPPKRCHFCNEAIVEVEPWGNTTVIIDFETKDAHEDCLENVEGVS